MIIPDESRECPAPAVVVGTLIGDLDGRRQPQPPVRGSGQTGARGAHPAGHGCGVDKAAKPAARGTAEGDTGKVGEDRHEAGTADLRTMLGG